MRQAGLDSIGEAVLKRVTAFREFRSVQVHKQDPCSETDSQRGVEPTRVRPSLDLRHPNPLQPHQRVVDSHDPRIPTLVGMSSGAPIPIHDLSQVPVVGEDHEYARLGEQRFSMFD